MQRINQVQTRVVCHRPDGLEEPEKDYMRIHAVCHRPDGLEVQWYHRYHPGEVCHRPDGLEELATSFQ